MRLVISIFVVAFSLVAAPPSWAIDEAAVADIKEGVELDMPNPDKPGKYYDFEVGEVSIYEFGGRRMYEIVEDGEDVLYLNVFSEGFDAYVLNEDLDPQDLTFKKKKIKAKSLPKRLARHDKNGKGRFDYDGGIYLYEDSEDGTVTTLGTDGKYEASYYLYYNKKDDNMALLFIEDDDDNFEVLQIIEVDVEDIEIQ